MRAVAVRDLRLTPTTSATPLCRIADIDPSVREALFDRLAKQPEMVEGFGRSTLSRLIPGVAERSAIVRESARRALDGWRDHYGSAIRLFEQCDVISDEELGETVAGVIAKRSRQESVVYVQGFLNTSTNQATDLHLKIVVALLTSTLFCGMDKDGQEEHIDVPSLLKRAERSDSACDECFVLRQLLHAVIKKQYSQDWYSAFLLKNRNGINTLLKRG